MQNILTGNYTAWQCTQPTAQLAQSLTGNMRTLECMNERSGSRDSTTDASADSCSVVPSLTAIVLAVRHALDVGDVDVITLRIESSGEERDFVFCVIGAQSPGSSSTSSNSFSCFLTITHVPKTFQE